MMFILFLWQVGGGVMTVKVAEFNSKASCEKAFIEFQNKLPWFTTLDHICVEK